MGGLLFGNIFPSLLVCLTHQRRVRSPDDGDAQRLARPRDLDVGDLALEHRQPGYT